MKPMISLLRDKLSTVPTFAVGLHLLEPDRDLFLQSEGQLTIANELGNVEYMSVMLISDLSVEQD